jgi:hypothetical protein
VCKDLLLNHKHQTPWQVLYEHQNDHAFITAVGFDTLTFQSILDDGFEELWNTMSNTDLVNSMTGNQVGHNLENISVFPDSAGSCPVEALLMS